MWKNIVIIILTIALIISLSYSLSITYALLERVGYFAHAYSVIRVFDDMEKRAIKEPENALLYAEYIKNHYPSGTVQPEGSQLDWLVEKIREETVARILDKALFAHTEKTIMEE